MFTRAAAVLVGFCIGGLAWQRVWIGVALGVVLALWLILDERAIESLDPDRPTRCRTSESARRRRDGGA